MTCVTCEAIGYPTAERDGIDADTCPTCHGTQTISDTSQEGDDRAGPDA